MRVLRCCVRSTLGLLLVLGVTVTATGEEAPSKMIHAVVAMSGTDIPADSFFAKPKTVWRASNQYCRVDEEPDPANGLHGNLIINEPDVWMVNLADNTAKHIVDPGPTFNCRLPIFAMSQEMAKSKIAELEIGRELEFFRAKGAKQIEGPKLEFEAKYYELSIGDSTLRLVERVDVHVPIMITMKSSDKTYTARYQLWEEVPFQAGSFAKPTGVKLEDTK